MMREPSDAPQELHSTPLIRLLYAGAIVALCLSIPTSPHAYLHADGR